MKEQRINNLKYTLLMMMLIALCGCAPLMTYEEMSIAYELATTPEEKKIAEERLERFEENSRKADAYFQNRAACENTPELMWYCDNAQSVDLKRIKTIDAKVRAYKKEHHECQCGNADEIMRQLRDFF